MHFDRWWNPAVENQATDRAYRIGQNNNVMVHKLVCKGTIEEKIDKLIESKKDLAENIIGSGRESWITEMSNAECGKKVSSLDRLLKGDFLEELKEIFFRCGRTVPDTKVNIL